MHGARRSRQDDGHEWRQIVRTIALVLSIAIPIAIVVYANHVPSTAGVNSVNGVGATGALVGLSLMIAVTVLAIRR